MTLYVIARVLHRWAGLAIAAFLVLAGTTGTIIAWDHELDLLLNRDFITAKPSGTALPALDLKAMVEARDERREVTYLPLVAEPGMSVAMYVEPRLNPATKTYPALGYNQVFVDPATGQELGSREWGAAWPVTRANVISFLYRFHSTLHLPKMWGFGEWGRWLMGGVALLWLLDCFAGLYLTLPAGAAAPKPAAGNSKPNKAQRPFLARWARAWQINWSGTPVRLIFDFHRAASLWLWLLLLILAMSGVALNLPREVFVPALSSVARVTPDPQAGPNNTPETSAGKPSLPIASILAIASEEGRKRGFADPPGAIGYARLEGFYRVWFFAPGGEHGVAGFEPPIVFVGAKDGAVLGIKSVAASTPADLFLKAQYPLHSGRILGLPGRILVSLLGIAVSAISITGVLIWYRRRAKRIASGRAAASAA